MCVNCFAPDVVFRKDDFVARSTAKCPTQKVSMCFLNERPARERERERERARDRDRETESD